MTQPFGTAALRHRAMLYTMSDAMIDNRSSDRRA
jgi:hypothetical protein